LRSRDTGHRFVTPEERRSAEEPTVDEMGNRENGEPQEWTRDDERDSYGRSGHHDPEAETGSARRPCLSDRGRRGIGIEHREDFVLIHDFSRYLARGLSFQLFAQDLLDVAFVVGIEEMDFHTVRVEDRFLEVAVHVAVASLQVYVSRAVVDPVQVLGFPADGDVVELRVGQLSDEKERESQAPEFR
jgi:hypothetical protein